jgi:predicted nucleotidyltransferase
MPSDKGKTENAGLSALLEGLIDAGIEFILVGGLAAVVQGAPITTMDVDIVHRQTTENIAKLLDFLKSIDAYHRRLDDKVIEPTEEHISGKGHALFTTRFGPLDVLAIIEEGKSYEDLIDHTVEIEFRGHTIRVLDLEMLVKLKKSAKDPKDNHRLPILEETLRQLKQDEASLQETKDTSTGDKSDES